MLTLSTLSPDAGRGKDGKEEKEVGKWPYYALNLLRGGAPKGARNGRFLILDWMGAELIAQKRGGPYYAPNLLRGGAPKGARNGRFLILDWMGAELIAQKRGGPYYAPTPLSLAP
jgi:hypothetical protein